MTQCSSSEQAATARGGDDELRVVDPLAGRNRLRQRQWSGCVRWLEVVNSMILYCSGSVFRYPCRSVVRLTLRPDFADREMGVCDALPETHEYHQEAPEAGLSGAHEDSQGTQDHQPRASAGPPEDQRGSIAIAVRGTVLTGSAFPSDRVSFRVGAEDALFCAPTWSSAGVRVSGSYSRIQFHPGQVLP